MTDYKKLQNKARRLGLKVVGVSAKKLEAAVAKEMEGADAVVMHAGHPVRTFSLEMHGENYKEIAEKFISHPDRKDYSIDYQKVVSRITCPSCGHKFRAA